MIAVSLCTIFNTVWSAHACTIWNCCCCPIKFAFSKPKKKSFSYWSTFTDIFNSVCVRAFVTGLWLSHRSSTIWNQPFPLDIEFQKTQMAVCGSRSVFSDCSLHNVTSKLGHLSMSANNAATCCRSRSSDNCRKPVWVWEKKNSPTICFFMDISCTALQKRRGNSIPHMEFGFRGFHSSSPACSSAGTAPDVSFDNSGREDQLASSTVSPEQYVFLSLFLIQVLNQKFIEHS